MAIDLLIFDLDGTLIHSAPDIAESAHILLEKHGYPPKSYDEIVNSIGDGMKKLVERIVVDRLDDNRLENLAGEFYRIYESRLLVETTLMPGVDDFLRQNRRKLAIVTNKPEALAKKIVSGTRLRDFTWTGIFGGDTFPKKKPDPLPLAEAMKHSGTFPFNSIMIGDGIADLRAARAAGMRAIALMNGYSNPNHLLMEKPDAVIESIDALQGVLAGGGYLRDK